MYTGFLVITIGIIAALIGMNASIVFQNISLTEETLLSLGQLQFQQFGRQSHFNKDNNDILQFARFATIFMGLIPIPFSIFAREILSTVFIARL
ncbi:hypothetical protein ASG65_22460 [Bacillus sp. Leaf13]|nr:hypothetical protein ASG65_22460 [Bacillus sp. Leaf13]